MTVPAGRQVIKTNRPASYFCSKIEKSPEELTPRGLAASVKKKDPVAMQVWDEFTSQLATGLVNTVWLLNPDRIVIGGGIAVAVWG